MQNAHMHGFVKLGVVWDFSTSVTVIDATTPTSATLPCIFVVG